MTRLTKEKQSVFSIPPYTIAAEGASISMKRLRLERWSETLLSPRTRPYCLRQLGIQQQIASTRSAASAAEAMHQDNRLLSRSKPKNSPFVRPSPPPEAALKSAKLAALHARISLPKHLPLQSLARTLVDVTADPNPNFNNSLLARLGGHIINSHVSEWLLCKYPRLPITVLHAAQFAYMGPTTLRIIAEEWGVETAAAPGEEVDPGLLQFKKMQPGTRLGDYYRGQSIASQVTNDEEFQDTIPKKNEVEREQPTEIAHALFAKALVGVVYLHSGRRPAKKFVNEHLLSRHLEVASLFKFAHPVKDLSRLCAREDFDYPIARVLSETGRHSRSPVFVVGVFSGNDMLGEGSGPSLNEARIRACANALKAWYMYSPGNNVRVPSDMETPDAKPWKPVHIDVGEIVS